MYCIRLKLLVVALVVFAIPDLGAAQVRRAFDPESYFKSLDRNGDQRLDKNELNPRATAYLKKIGMDVSDDRIKLRNISRQLERNKEASAEQAAQAGQQNPGKTLKVPGFGLEAEEYSVSGFGGAAAEGDNIEFSQEVIDRVNGVLKVYDRNNDNIIDEEERNKARWGRPDPKESDLNGDGLLSRDELLRRYHFRGQEQDRQRSESRSGDSGRGRDSYRRREESNRSSSSRSRTTSRTSSSSSSSRTSRSSSANATNYENYSKSLIKRYDKDKDNRLSKKEWGEIRRPPANADTNKDGFVTQKEYAKALQAAAEKGTSAASTKKTSASRVTGVKASTGSKSKTTSKSKSSSKGGAGDLSKLDKDSDNQVQMHEYSSDWDDKKLKEFYEIDTNRDGVITPTEWQNK